MQCFPRVKWNQYLCVLVCTCVYLLLSTGAVSLDWFHSSQNQQLKLANKATEGGITVIMSAELGLYLMLCQDSTRPVFTCAPIPYRTIHLAWLWILGKFIPCTSLENTLQKTSNAFVLNPRPQIRPSSKGSIWEQSSRWGRLARTSFLPDLQGGFF